MRETMRIEGRHAVREALRAGLSLEKMYVLKSSRDAALLQLVKEAGETGIRPDYVEKETLDRLSETGHHQGVIAETAAVPYVSVEEILAAAAGKGEDPFLILLDGIEDPHNLGAILRTANQAGVHGVIIPKDRAVGLTAAVARTSAGAVYHTPVARVTNLSRTIEELKQKGIWLACADMDGTVLYRQDLRGPIGLVIGAEGKGVSPLVKKHCDFTVSVPMCGDIDSLNASVAAGILTFEVVRQRRYSS